MKLHTKYKKKGIWNYFYHLSNFHVHISPQAVTLLSRQKSSVILSSAHFSLITDTKAHAQAHTSLGSLDNRKSWKIKEMRMTR